MITVENGQDCVYRVRKQRCSWGVGLLGWGEHVYQGSLWAQMGDQEV